MNTVVAGFVKQFPNIRVAVIGDLMLDSYLSGNTRRLCQEAPVPVVDINHHAVMPGGAGNVAVNLAAMGAQVRILSVVGDDGPAVEAIAALQQRNVHTCGVIRCSGRSTLTKQRVLSDGQLVARLDEGTASDISEEQESALIDRLKTTVLDVDVLIISDYGYGIVTERIITAIQDLRHSDSAPLIVVDAKRLERYRAVRPTAVKPNYQQLCALLQLPTSATSDPRWRRVQHLSTELLAATEADIVAATLDCEGSIIFSHDQPPYRTYAHPSPACQTAGAGDTYLAGLALAVAAKASPQQAGDIAAAASDIVVHETHTSVCSREALLRRLQGELTDNSKLNSLAQVLENYRHQGRRIVLTNGCFDILHRGHITYLEQARSLGDVLIVGVNGDDSIRRLKGPERPINSLEDRLRVLSALSCVDHLVSFHEDTPHRLIEAIRPDVFVKGGDYTRDTLPEASLVEELGGSIKILPFIEGRSTTRIIQRMTSLTAAGEAAVSPETVLPDAMGALT